jgi:hypothetical protein
MRTVRSEPCIRKVNRETIQRQRGQASTGSGNTGERGEGPGHALFCAPQPSSEEGHLAPGILGKGVLLRVPFFWYTLHEASRAQVPAGHSGFAFIEASFRWRAEASFRWRAEASSAGGLRHPSGGELGETNSALGDRGALFG